MRRLILFALCASLTAAFHGCGGSSDSGGGGATAPVGAPIVAPPVGPVAAPGGASGGSTLTSATTPAQRVSLVSPYLDEKTIAIARLDLSVIDADKVLAEATKSRPGVEITDQQRAEMQEAASKFKEVQGLVQEVQVLLSLNDISRATAGALPTVIVKTQSGVDPKRVYSLYANDLDPNGPVDQAEFDKACFVQGDVVVFASPGSLYKFRNNVQPAVISNLEQAFTLAGNAPAQVIYAPTDQVRQELGAFTLPPDFGIDANTLMQGLSYGAISLSPPPGGEFKVEVQGRDPGVAQQVHSLLTNQMQQLRQFPGMSPENLEILDALMPKLENDRIVLALREGDPVFQKLEAMAIQGGAGQGGGAQKMQSANNLKQIALAMHNHHDATGSLPQANKNGLSWRVHLLPYLEEQQLYQQFNLNEPWDSPTNRPLVEKMPSVFKHPAAKTAEPGMTVYLGVAGMNSAFPPDRGLRISEFVDGTTNTAWVVEADPNFAAYWTKPDDWQLNESAPQQGLGSLWGDGSALAAMADGRVIAVKSTGDPEQLRRMFLRNDAQVIDFAQIEHQGGVPRPSGGGGLPFPIPGFGPPGMGLGGPGGLGESPLVGPPGAGENAPEGEVTLNQLGFAAMQGDQALQAQFGNGKVTRVTGKLKGVLDTTVTFETDAKSTDGRPINVTFIIADRTSQPSDLSFDRPVTIEGQFESYYDNTVRFTNARWVQPGDPPPGTIIPGQDPEFIAAAKEAFAEGRNADAFQYLYAEALAGPDQYKLRSSLRWAPALKRPALAIRWGLAVEYNAPRNYSGGPAPIGRVIQNQGNQPNQGGVDPGRPQDGADPKTVIDYYSSEIGTQMLEGLELRREQGQFGEILTALFETNANDPNSGAPFNPGQQFQNDPAAAAARLLAGKPLPIAPGVVFLGIGKETDMLKKAKENEVDALVLVDVGVSPTRTVVINSTRLVLFNGATGESVHASKPLKATVVEQQREQGRGETLVSDLIEKFFEAVDQNFTLTELPAALNETNVTARVQKLTASPPANPLETLTEIAFWREQGLITDETAEAAYVAIIGEDGAKLMGNLAERKSAIEKYLPKSKGAGATIPGGGRRLGLP